MGTTTSILYNYVFTTADTFFIRVRFCDNDNQWGAYYTFTIEIIDCKRYYYVKDHPSTSSGQVLGNIRQTVDKNGNIISAQDYNPGVYPDAKQIGREIVRSYNNADANDKYKFTEKERDKETNLDYFGARYYDASIGRWLNIDPLTDLYPGITPYNYVNNNPLNLIDPKGLATQNEKEDDEDEDRFSSTDELYNYLTQQQDEETNEEFGLSPNNDEGEKKKNKGSVGNTFSGLSTGTFIGGFIPFMKGKSLIIEMELEMYKRNWLKKFLIQEEYASKIKNVKVFGKVLFFAGIGLDIAYGINTGDWLTSTKSSGISTLFYLNPFMGVLFFGIDQTLGLDKGFNKWIETELERPDNLWQPKFHAPIHSCCP